jgi:hypothetical protein
MAFSEVTGGHLPPEVENVTVGRNACLDDPAQRRHEQVALVRAHHRYAAERIRLQQPAKALRYWRCGSSPSNSFRTLSRASSQHGARS